MKVSLVWADGTITRMQSVNALKIAQRWLYKYSDLLSIYCSTNHTLYMREGQPDDSYHL